MSVQAMTWAFAADTKNSSMKLVLLCLANYAGRDGHAFPGQKSIAKESKLSLRTVNTSLKALEDDGFIRRVRRNRDDGTRTSDLYILCLDNVQSLHVGETDNVQNLQGQHATIAHQYKPNGLSEPVSEPLVSCADGFQEFWQQYPRKVAKPTAERAYLKALKKNKHTAIMVGTMKHTAAWAACLKDAEFIPHPSTFLNQERFNDEPDQPAQARPRKNSKLDERSAEVEKFARNTAARIQASRALESTGEAFNFGNGTGGNGQDVG